MLLLDLGTGFSKVLILLKRSSFLQIWSRDAATFRPNMKHATNLSSEAFHIPKSVVWLSVQTGVFQNVLICFHFDQFFSLYKCRKLLISFIVIGPCKWWGLLIIDILKSHNSCCKLDYLEICAHLTFGTYNLSVSWQLSGDKLGNLWLTMLVGGSC